MPYKSNRAAAVQPFQVMRLLARAKQLEQQGRDIIHMEVGEPDFPTPQPVIEAAQDVIARGEIFYSPATGLPQLKACIARFYHDRYALSIDPERIIVTPGASGALLLALAAVIDPGKKIMMSDPGYPCNRNFTYFLQGEVVAIPVGAETNYQLTASLIQQHWDEDIVGVLLASPSNPTGTLLDTEELRRIVDFVEQQGAVVFMDEIYHGLVYADTVPTVLSFSDQVFVINSFSKYFGMTGWRIGWLVAPEMYIKTLDNFAQNIFLAAPTPSQYAAMAAFDPASIAILEERRMEFRYRRDFLLPALRELGFTVTTEPEGAFYIYADCSRFTQNSLEFCEKMLDEIGVAITPGADFGSYQSSTHIRFAYTTSLERLKEGVARLGKYLADYVE